MLCFLGWFAGSASPVEGRSAVFPLSLMATPPPLLLEQPNPFKPKK
jgi:hypothetical protein